MNVYACARALLSGSSSKTHEVHNYLRSGAGARGVEKRVGFGRISLVMRPKMLLSRWFWGVCNGLVAGFLDA